ncbi:MAG: formate--tetrahydrofolate ligase [Bacteroidales bacterium]|nr:formate--tetrahydrofolate ligase [Bacteroidales bacterium]
MKDIEIAQSVKMHRIEEIAAKLGVSGEKVLPFGHYKGKLMLDLIDEEKIKKSKLILVSAITATPAGEGKTTVSIGLSEAFNRLNKKTTVVLREPSLGPVFGVKGGAAGGGWSQVLPMEDINLHFTGDLNAVEKAHNLLSAMIDNHLHSGNKLNIDPRTIVWKRAIDMNDRSLRKMVIGLGGTAYGIPRETGFIITAASEVMAALCLSESLSQLRQKLGNIYIGDSFEGNAVFARDLKASGAMTALLKDALMPNLVQTIEGNPAIIHGGPFANIAQGTNSIIATKMGMTFSDYVVTEAGFATDLGAEKFFDIKMQYAGLTPHATVIVTTIKALKYHGGIKLKELEISNENAVKEGLNNLEKHIENIREFGINPIVAINRYSADSEEEINIVSNFCHQRNVKVAVVDVWGKGGGGAIELAEMLIHQIESTENQFKPLYRFEENHEEKIKRIATKIYGAGDVQYSIQAKKDLDRIEALGYGNLPVCIAKTQKSLSDDQYKKGRPQGFTVKIQEVKLNSGAGFIVPIAGTILRMPGLPITPAAENIDIDDQGVISGLF